MCQVKLMLVIGIGGQSVNLNMNIRVLLLKPGDQFIKCLLQVGKGELIIMNRVGRVVAGRIKPAGEGKA